MRRYARGIIIGMVAVLLPTLLILPLTEGKRSSKTTPTARLKKAKEARKLHAKVASQDLAGSPSPISSRAVGFAISPPVNELGARLEPSKSMRFGKAAANFERPEKAISPSLSGKVDFEKSLGGKATKEAESEPAITLSEANFEGLSSLDNDEVQTIAAFVFPPDTVGDVGPSQYAQATNLLFRVYNKSGLPLTEKIPISSVFTALGPPCATVDDGDPIVLYDSLADRWIVTQFMVSGPAPLSQCFAISQTGDAAGSYFLYRFVMPNNKFNDYPKFGVWPDGYYLTNNQFSLAGTSFLGVGVFALDREKILAGDPTAGFIYFDLEATHPTARGMLPSDADGLNPPPPGAPNVFAYFNADEFAGDAGDSLRLFEFHADFAEPANSTFTERVDSPLPVEPFNPLNPVGLDDIEQPLPAGPTSALDSISDRLMHRLQYRNFGSYEALTTNHTVNVGTGNSLFTHQAGIRYYELRRSLPRGTWVVREQATHSPDAENRWMGSAAMDNQGNLAVGYSVSSATTFPGIRYAGRLVNDPLGGLFQGERTLIAGSGVQTNNGSRWGDYSSMNVDPLDDCTFWYTQEYYQTTDPTPTTAPFGVNWQTRVGSFRFAQCTAPPQGSLKVNVTNCDSGLPIPGAAINVGGILYDSTDSAGINASQHAPGVYPVLATKSKFRNSGSSSVEISAGEVSVINICLMGTPSISSSAVTLINESCPPYNNAIDPNERVTVSFRLSNNGSASTSNLIATLQPTGGITAPSRPQSYGAVGPGEQVARDFSLTANGLCGNVITATLALHDGDSSLGTLSFNFSLGPAPLEENFDHVITPMLPVGWIASQGVNAGAFSQWITSSSGTLSPVADSLPNAVFTQDPNNVLDNRLETPTFYIFSSSTQLSFRHHYVLEDNTASVAFDAGVLEISIAGGEFADIIAAGGTFVQGGYNKSAIDSSFFNPLLPSRPNWSGNSGGFVTTVVSLPPGAIGQPIKVRWRLGSDNSVSGQGWRIDNVRIIESACTVPCGIVRLVVSSQLTRIDELTVMTTYRVQNIGTLMASDVAITSARLGTVTGSPLPQLLGDIEPGAHSSIAEIFFSHASPGAPSISGLSGTYRGGTFSSTKRVIVP